MLNAFYKLITPWGIATKGQILKNRLLGRLVNYLYPLYCRIVPIRRPTTAVEKVVVSLTTFPARIDQVYLTINSLLRQTIRAEKVILWLAETQFPCREQLPKRLLQLEEMGLEIRFCSDIKSYKKIFYTAQEYHDYQIVTADDDVLYPEMWLERLLETSRAYPDCVVCYRAHQMHVKGNVIAPYKEWNGLAVGIKGPSLLLVPTGVGGVLYPSQYFEDEVFDLEMIKETCPSADDLWLKAIGLCKKIPAVKVDTESIEWFTVLGTQKENLFSLNTGESAVNDAALTKLVKQYNIDILSLVEE